MPLGYIGSIIYGTSFNPDQSTGVIVLNDVVVSVTSDRKGEYVYDNVYTAARAYAKNRGLVLNTDHDFCDAMQYAGRFLEIYLKQNNIEAAVTKINGFVMVRGENLRFRCQHHDIDLKAHQFDEESNVYTIDDVSYGPLTKPADLEVRNLLDD